MSVFSSKPLSSDSEIDQAEGADSNRRQQLSFSQKSSDGMLEDEEDVSTLVNPSAHAVGRLVQLLELSRVRTARMLLCDLP